MPIILATWEAEIERIMVQGHARQNIISNFNFKKLSMVLYVCNPSYAGSRSRRIVVQAGLAKTKDSVSKK
jgi:hypothetical protein